MAYYMYVVSAKAEKKYFWQKRKCYIAESVFSVTHNYNPMFKEIVGEHPYDWEFKKLKYQRVKIHKALRILNSNRDNYRYLEPENKWGTVGGFIDWLELLYDWTRKYPNYYLQISK